MLDYALDHWVLASAFACICFSVAYVGWQWLTASVGEDYDPYY